MPKLTRINPVLEILRASPGRISRLMLQQDAGRRLLEVQSLARSAHVPVIHVPRKQLDRIDRQHQGLAAVVAPKPMASVEEILAASPVPFVMLLDGIEDPQNLGGIVRTCEGAGVDGLIIPERRAAGLTDTVFQVSAGALEHLRVARVTNLARTIGVLQQSGLWIVGAEGSGGRPWYDFDYTQPVGLVMGSEGKGLRDLVKRNCDEILSLPLAGHITSLNVASAAAVFIYEVIRQRVSARG